MVKLIMKKKSLFYNKFFYTLLLAVLSTTGLSIYAQIDVNPLLKGYSLLLFIQGGFAIIYLVFYRQIQKKYSDL
jgi:hypothetical protein